MEKKSQNKRRIKYGSAILLLFVSIFVLLLTVERFFDPSDGTVSASPGAPAQSDPVSAEPSLPLEPSPTASMPSELPISESPSPSSESTLKQRIAEKLAAMTLSEKVLQLFMIRPEALTGSDEVTAADIRTFQALQTYPVGGFIFFSSNIVNPDQLKAMTQSVQEYAREIEGMPLFLGIDEEGGRVARIANSRAFEVEKYSDMASIGAAEDYEKAYWVGRTIGDYLRAYGFNLDFAPVADVLTNPDNTVIGSRSFGADCNIVAKMDLKVAKGLAESQVLSCYKHFPGHGGTEEDTHEGAAYTNKTLDELMACELVPFQAAADAKIPFIMVSHISAPNVVGDNTPASLSKIMITDILRERIGYEGIIITDSMRMGAIVNTFDPNGAVVQAIQAGADIILIPLDFKAAYQAVLDAVRDGTITEGRIDQSVERILQVKLDLSND